MASKFKRPTRPDVKSRRACPRGAAAAALGAPPMRFFGEQRLRRFDSIDRQRDLRGSLSRCNITWIHPGHECAFGSPARESRAPRMSPGMGFASARTSSLVPKPLRQVQRSRDKEKLGRGRTAGTRLAEIVRCNLSAVLHYAERASNSGETATGAPHDNTLRSPAIASQMNCRSVARNAHLDRGNPTSGGAAEFMGQILPAAR